MIASTVFPTGRREISAASAAALKAAGIDPASLFARHERGDWGDVPDWLQADNDRAAPLPRSSHALQSLYRVSPNVEVRIVSAADRSRTRMMRADEFGEIEVSVQEGYRQWAGSYEGRNPLIDVESPVVDAMLATLPRIASAIDVGCGTGRLARKLARNGVARVYAVDATPEMLAVARETSRQEGLERIVFERAVLGAQLIPSESGAFDLLTCGLMLCHLPDLKEGIRECARVVRPGGWLLLSDFHPATSSFGWRTDFIVPEGRLLFPNTPNTRQDYLDGLTESGCEILDVRDIALDGSPYGEISESIMRDRGWPPLCLVILAWKRVSG